MRWMLIERDNVTHPSDPDADGNSYVASFEFFPFCEGATFAVYKGILNGDACRRGQFCVVKTLVERAAQCGELNHVIQRAREAHRLAASFNNLVGYRALWFAIPFLSRLKHVSDFNGMFRCFAPHDKKLVRDEYAVIETLIEGTFQVFNSKNGTVSTPPVSNTVKTLPKSKNKRRNKRGTDYRYDSYYETNTTESLGPNNLAQAFGHYVWFATETSVICGLEGVFSNSSYFFTTPVIHSISSSFGPTDGGPDAIAEFFASHRCTNVCHQWPVYSPQSVNRKNQINFFQSDARLSFKSSVITDKNIFVEKIDFTKENH